MSTMKAAFTKANEVDLHHLARLWGLEGLDGQARQHVEQALLAQMRLPFAARGVWLHLSAAARLCLFAILSAPPKKGLLRTQLGRKTKLPPAEVEDAIAELQAAWLISATLVYPPIPLHGPRPGPEEAVSVLFPAPESAEALAHTGRELLVHGWDRSQWELRSLLEQLSWETTQALARLCAVPLETYERWRPVPVSGIEVREQLRQRLESSPAVFALLRRLEPPARQIWTWLWAQGRTAPLDTLQQALGLTRSDLARLLPQLEAHALLFETLTPTGERLVFFPLTFYERLQPEVSRFLAEEQARAWTPLAVAPVSARTSLPVLLYDLAVLVGWVYQTTVEPTKEGKLPKRLNAQLRARLQGVPRLDDLGQDGYPDLLAQAALDLRLLQRVTPYEGARARYAPGPALAAWGQATTEEQAKRFLTWWEGTMDWQDLLPDRRALPAYYWTTTDRTRLLDQLRRCHPGGWYRVSSLLYALWQQAPLDLSGERARAGTGPLAALHAQRERWLERDGQRTLGMLCSTLADLGLVELGWEEADQRQVTAAAPAAVRLTPLGMLALGVAPAGEETTGDAAGSGLIVQPSFELVLLQTRLPLVYALLPWAEAIQIGVAATLRLTQRSVLRGLAHGGRLEDLLGLLTTSSGREAPQNVAYSLKDWARGHQGALLAQVFLLQLSSAEVAETAQKVLAQHRIPAHPLAPDLLALPSDLTSLSVVYRCLEQVGIVVQRGLPPGRLP